MPPSFAYTFFDISNGNPYATCKLCGTVVKCWIDGSRLGTSTMIRHLHRKHSEELCKFPSSSFDGVEPQTSSADREKELNAFFNNDSDGEAMESLCNSESSLARCEQLATPKCGELSVSPDINHEILGYIQILMQNVSRNNNRLAQLEKVKSTQPESDVDDQNDSEDYEPKFITVNGFTFEDYPR